MGLLVAEFSAEISQWCLRHASRKIKSASWESRGCCSRLSAPLACWRRQRLQQERQQVSVTTDPARRWWGPTQFWNTVRRSHCRRRRECWSSLTRSNQVSEIPPCQPESSPECRFLFACFFVCFHIYFMIYCVSHSHTVLKCVWQIWHCKVNQTQLVDRAAAAMQSRTFLATWSKPLSDWNGLNRYCR